MPKKTRRADSPIDDAWDDLMALYWEMIRALRARSAVSFPTGATLRTKKSRGDWHTPSVLEHTSGPARHGRRASPTIPRFRKERTDGPCLALGARRRPAVVPGLLRARLPHHLRIAHRSLLPECVQHLDRAVWDRHRPAAPAGAPAGVIALPGEWLVWTDARRGYAPGCRRDTEDASVFLARPIAGSPR